MTVIIGRMKLMRELGRREKIKIISHQTTAKMKLSVEEFVTVLYFSR